MKKLSPRTALFSIACGASLMACGTSAPTQASDPAAGTTTEVGSASEAIRQLGVKDADVVAKCEQLVQGCDKFAGDSGVGAAVCDKIGEHCAELAEQLGEARNDFQQCLESVAACEASAATPADCKAKRAACNPAGKDFESRRGETLVCAERVQSCLPRPRGLAVRANEADAGADSCNLDASDFVGCCHGRANGPFGGGDAGAAKPPLFGRGGAEKPGLFGRGPSAGGAGSPPHGAAKSPDEAANAADDAEDAEDPNEP